MSATESKAQPQPQPNAVAGVSMRDLLASCAAANAVSTPPRVPDPQAVERPAEHRKAA
ncbi:hypothetical protein AB0H86_33630 [Streptomyces sp. NPDC050997]|uniref:hypothetical protein n=1 Tax=Streptomyces sp. NPDC050997 TaxID=3155519 RepID=UPI0034136225